MPRSPRSQSLLVVGLGVLLLATGSAFAYTFGSTLAWQQRDAVTATATGYEVTGGDAPALLVAVTVENPTRRAMRLAEVDLVVYDGGPPFERDDRLTVPYTARVPEVTIAPGGRRTVTVRVDVASDDVDRARAAVANDTATASGVLRLELGDRGFYVDV